MRRGSIALGLVAATVLAAPAGAETVRVFAAGSLKGVVENLKTLLPGVTKDIVIDATFGPSGALRKRIEGGDKPDLFLSADMASPKSLYDASRTVLPPVAFARNRMCLYGKATAFRTSVLDTMLDPTLKLATSTPVVDPGGDYALQVMQRADAMKPGATQVLTAKAMHLLGGDTKALPGHGVLASIFLRGDADLAIVYCSGAAALEREVPGLEAKPVPDALEPNPLLGLAVLSDKPSARDVALVLLSAAGQDAVAKAGLLPLRDVSPERAAK